MNFKTTPSKRTDRPALSVILPVHDGQRTLPATLASWLAQDRQDWELLLVDNLSGDGSSELLHHAARRNPERGPSVRCFREERPGQSAASNRGATEARGRLLVFSAQDMLVPPDFLSRHLAAHSRAEPPCCVLGHIDYPRPLLDDRFLRCVVEETVYQFGFQAVGDPSRANPRCLYAPNFSLPAAVFRELGGFDEEFPWGWQDTDLGLRLSAAGIPLRYESTLIALHDHPLDWRGFCRRMEHTGGDLPRFLLKHPGFDDTDLLRRMLTMHFLDARRMVSAAQKLVLRWEEDPAAPLPRIELANGSRDTLSAAFVLLLKYHHFKGVHDGGRRLFGRELWQAWLEGKPWPALEAVLQD